MKCQLCNEIKEEGYICLSCHKKVMNALDNTALKYLHEYYEVKKKLENLSPSPNSRTIQSSKTFDNPHVEKAYLECVQAFNNLPEKERIKFRKSLAD